MKRASLLALVALVTALVAQSSAKPRAHRPKKTPKTAPAPAPDPAPSPNSPPTPAASTPASAPSPAPSPAPAPSRTTAPAAAPGSSPATAPTSTMAPGQTPTMAPGQTAAGQPPPQTTFAPGQTAAGQASPHTTSAPGQPAAGQTAPPQTTFAPGQTATLTMRSKQAHGGFVEDLDCSACHTSDGWGLAATAGKSGFDHDRTGFPLRGSHIQTTCSGCHTAKGKPATTCEGCHRDPHEGRNDGTCAECHTAVAWSDTKTLDQHRRTRMPLTGAHASVDCAACHKRQAERVYSDTPSDCYSCHREDYRKVNPQIHHLGDQNGPFTRECGTCHQTTAWKPAYAVPTMMARTLSTTDHDAVFALSTGSHKAFECSSCHVDTRRAKAVRCDGCHTSVMLRTEHARPVAAVASGCLRCHPRGAPR